MQSNSQTITKIRFYLISDSSNIPNIIYIYIQVLLELHNVKKLMKQVYESCKFSIETTEKHNNNKSKI